MAHDGPISNAAPTNVPHSHSSILTMPLQCQITAPSNHTPLKSTETEAFRHLVWIMWRHTLLSNHVCVCLIVCGEYSVCQRWVAMHISQIRPVTGPLEGQAEQEKEHLKRHILVWQSEEPSFTQPALIWITLYICILLSFFFLPLFYLIIFHSHTEETSLLLKVVYFNIYSFLHGGNTLWCLSVWGNIVAGKWYRPVFVICAVENKKVRSKRLAFMSVLIVYEMHVRYEILKC